MKLSDVKAFFGHQVHICRYREAGTLLRWLGADLYGKRVLDVAGGDGYWAGRVTKRGAEVVSVDLSRRKMLYGRTLAHPPSLVEGDALALPFSDAAFDAILSVCAIEQFDDGGKSLDEMSRVLKPGGEILLSADVLSRADEWPRLRDAHKAKYFVKQTYTHESIGELLDARSLELVDHCYQFRGRAAERLYLWLSVYGGRAGFNAAAPLIPLVALADRRSPNERGSLVLIHARRRF